MSSPSVCNCLQHLFPSSTVRTLSNSSLSEGSAVCSTTRSPLPCLCRSDIFWPSQTVFDRSGLPTQAQSPSSHFCFTSYFTAWFQGCDRLGRPSRACLCLWWSDEIHISSKCQLFISQEKQACFQPCSDGPVALTISVHKNEKNSKSPVLEINDFHFFFLFRWY